jgi:hypothetical protein
MATYISNKPLRNGPVNVKEIYLSGLFSTFIPKIRLGGDDRDPIVKMYTPSGFDVEVKPTSRKPAITREGITHGYSLDISYHGMRHVVSLFFLKSRRGKRSFICNTKERGYVLLIDKDGNFVKEIDIYPESLVYLVPFIPGTYELNLDPENTRSKWALLIA